MSHWNSRHPARTARNIFMRLTRRRAVGAIFACSSFDLLWWILVRSGAALCTEEGYAARRSLVIRSGRRTPTFNTLGVAYITSSAPRCGKIFESSRQADHARLNLGCVSARPAEAGSRACAALEAATQQLRRIAYGGTNLALLSTKTSGDARRASPHFRTSRNRAQRTGRLLFLSAT